MNQAQIRLLKGKTTDLDWYHFWHNQNQKLLIWDIFLLPFVKIHSVFNHLINKIIPTPEYFPQNMLTTFPIKGACRSLQVLNNSSAKSWLTAIVISVTLSPSTDQTNPVSLIYWKINEENDLIYFTYFVGNLTRLMNKLIHCC